MTETITMEQAARKYDDTPLEMRIKNGVAIAVTCDATHEFLIAKRKNAHGTGEWALPGGSIDPGELSVDAAVRELKEETGLQVTGKDLELVNTCINFFSEQDIEWVTVLFRYRLDPDICGDPRRVKNTEPAKKEGEYWSWCDWDRLPHPLFKPLEHIYENGMLHRALFARLRNS